MTNNNTWWTETGKCQRSDRTTRGGEHNSNTMRAFQVVVEYIPSGLSSLVLQFGNSSLDERGMIGLAKVVWG